jgi:DNA-binding XRE family transcriptional regulator
LLAINQTTGPVGINKQYKKRRKSMSDTSKTKSEFTSYGAWRDSQQFDEREIASGVQGLYREMLEFKLREIREMKSLTQTQLANQLGVTQNRISKFERIDLERAELQTIRSYIHALGGKLKLVVELDEIEYPLA